MGRRGGRVGDKVAWTTSMYLAFIFLALMLDAVL